MSYMGRQAIVSMHALRWNLRKVVARVERGQTIEVTRRGKPVARLVPVIADLPKNIWPDLEQRTRSVFGARTVRPAGSDVVRDQRGDR